MKLNFKSIDLAIAFCLMAVVTILYPSVAAAGNEAPDQITNTLCIIVNALTGGIGKAIATIAVVVLGIGLFMGKLSWPVAASTAIGIGLIFGAAQIVGWISAGSKTAFDCATLATK